MTKNIFLYQKITKEGINFFLYKIALCSSMAKKLQGRAGINRKTPQGAGSPFAAIK